MATWLRQSVAATIRFGPYLDYADGVTEEITLSPTVQIAKGPGTFSPRNSATAITHDANGWYGVVLDTIDTNTLGPLIAKSHSGTIHLPVWREFLVIPPNVYDSLISTTEWLQVDSFKPDWSISGSTLTVKKPDDSTTAYTKTLTQDASANPVISAT